MLDLEQYQIKGATAREIAASAEQAIRDGLIDSGEALPTVRGLAAALRTSPATVNAAYRILRQRGLVIGEGRRGTRVAPRPAVRAPERVHAAPERMHADHDRGDARAVRDLTVGLPDPALLPSLTAALAQIDLKPKLRISRLDAADPELLELARASFESDGVVAAALAVVSGAFDGIERVLQAHLRPGDRVLIEDPAYTSIRDILLALGLVAVPVTVDDRGLDPAALEAALAKGAEAMVIVPRAQNPLGAALDDQRASVVRSVLERSRSLLIVEDDHAGAVSGVRFASTISPDRQRWSVIRSVSKVLHPDMRLALLAGDPTTVARVEGRQALGPRWVSHVLQAIAARMLRDPAFGPTCARAADVYGARRTALISALAEHGIEASGRSGLNVWVRVREEATVVRSLLDAGWLVLAGERFRMMSSPGVRITISTLRDGEAGELARVIAGVEQAGRPRSTY